MTDPQGGTGTSGLFLKSWDDYVAASQLILERLQNPAAGQARITLPFFEVWQEFAKTMGMNSDFTGAATFKPKEMLANLAPALGATREYQTILQRMAELGLLFQHAYAEFLKQNAGIGEQALQAVQKRAAAEPGITGSPAGAYEAWIDCAEQAYAQSAHSDAFARSLGDLCNTLSAFKVERGKLLEAFAKHLDLPSRAEVDSLHRKIHELTSVARDATSTPSIKKPPKRKPRNQIGK